MAEDIDEDAPCRNKECTGKYWYVKNGDCFCHLSPLCWACTEAYLECGVCGDRGESDGAR